MVKKHFYSEADIELIKLNYADTDTIKIAEILGKPLHSIYRIAGDLGLKKSADYLKKAGYMVQKFGSPHRFKKGEEPKNKGKKLSPEVYEKVKATMFKKGQVAPNAREDGSERVGVEGYVLVRTAPGIWELKHRRLWEATFGPIPAGMVLRLKDGNKQNIVIENLELLTKEQHMLRNSIQNYPADIKTVIKLNGRLQKKISQLNNNTK